MSGCQMVRFLNGGLKIGQKCLLYGLNVQYSNDMIKPFENWTKKVSEEWNVWVSGVRFSDGYFIYKTV